MKNKEIEKILFDMDLIANHDKVPIYFTQNKVKLLLSYIEQLEKDNKYLDKENQILFESNLKLQNNRDKAYKFVKEKRKVFEWYDTDLFYLESLLKGDSE